MQGSAQQWQTLVDMGNFTSNLDDMIQIEVDYLTPILIGDVSSPTPISYCDTIEVLLD